MTRKELAKRNKDLRIKYHMIINAFNLASEELYGRTVVLATQNNLQEFKKFLIRKANEK